MRIVGMWCFLWALLVCDSFLCILLVCDGFLYILLVCDGFFMHIVSVKIIFSMKRGYVYVWGTCKNAWVLRVCFLKSKSIQATKWPRTVYLQLLILEIMTLRYLKTLVFDKVFKKIQHYLMFSFLKSIVSDN